MTDSTVQQWYIWTDSDYAVGQFVRGENTNANVELVYACLLLPVCLSPDYPIVE